MASITSSGLNGIDVNSLVSQLVSAERTAPAARLTERETKVQGTISAYGTLTSAVDKFKTSLAKLKDEDALAPLKATVAKPDNLSVATRSTAQAGSYNISVERLAQNQQVASAGLAATDTPIGQGSLTIGNGTDSFSVTIDSTNDSLTGLRDAINNASGNDSVSASIVRSDNGFQLVLSAKETGAANAFNITAADTLGNPLTDPAVGTLGMFSYSTAGGGAMTSLQTAQDAQIKVNNLTRSSATNEFNDVIAGVTFTAKVADAGNAFKVDIAEDSSATTTALQGFVDAYNSLQSTMIGLTNYDAAAKTAGRLQGDSLTMRLGSAMRSALNTPVDGADAAYNTLAELGVVTKDKNGSLQLKADVLKDALAANPEALKEFFTGDNGFAVKMEKALSAFTGADSQISSKTKSLQSELKSIDRQQEALDFRMESLQSRLMKQFSALDNMLTQMNSTSSFLSQQLSLL